MNEDFSDLEAELKRMRPRAPSSDLQARLAKALDRSAAPTAPSVNPHRSAAPRRSWPWVLWPTAAVAAMTLAFVTMRQTDSIAPTTDQTDHPVSGTVARPIAATAVTADLYQPVSAENILYDSRDEGLITLDDGTAAHRVFQRYVDTYTWRNPRTNASLRWTVPRDEVRVIPVRAY